MLENLLMIKNEIVVSLITARSGSKRVPNKNLRKFQGLSLIGWSCRAAGMSQFVDYNFISTDSHEYADEAKIFGVESIMRPKNISSDLSSSSEAIIHAYNFISKSINKEIRYLVLLQPTSPLRDRGLIDGCIKKLSEDKNADQLIEFCELNHFTYSKSGNYVIPDFDEDTRSQDIPTKYVPSGRIFIYDMQKISSKKFDFNSLITLPVIGPDIVDNINIDVESDFMKLELVYQKYSEKYNYLTNIF